MEPGGVRLKNCWHANSADWLPGFHPVGLDDKGRIRKRHGEAGKGNDTGESFRGDFGPLAGFPRAWGPQVAAGGF